MFAGAIVIIFAMYLIVTLVVVIVTSLKTSAKALPSSYEADWSALKLGDGVTFTPVVLVDAGESWATVYVELTWEPACALDVIISSEIASNLELTTPDKAKLTIGEVDFWQDMALALSTRVLVIVPGKSLRFRMRVGLSNVEKLLAALAQWIHDRGFDDVYAPARGVFWRWLRDTSLPLSLRLTLLKELHEDALVVELKALALRDALQLVEGLHTGRLSLGLSAELSEAAQDVLVKLMDEPALDAHVTPLEVRVLKHVLALFTKRGMIKLNEEGAHGMEASLPEPSLWWLVDRLLAHGELTQVGEGSMVLWWRLLEGGRLDEASIKALAVELSALPAPRLSLVVRWSVLGWEAHRSPLSLALKRQALLVFLPHIEQGLLLELLGAAAVKLWEDDALRQALNHYIFERDESDGWQQVLEASLSALGQGYARALLEREPRAKMMHPTKRAILLELCQQSLARQASGKLTISDSQKVAGALTSASPRHELTLLDDE